MDVQIRPIAGANLDLAIELVQSQWGIPYAKRFYTEVMYGLFTDRWHLLGAFVNGVMRGTGSVVKSDIDFSLWGLTWVVIDPVVRRQGVGSVLIRTMEQFACHDKVHYPATNVTIELTTTTPAFYESLGYRTVWHVGEGCIMMKTLD